MNATDAIFLGHLGQNEMAAAGLAQSWTWSTLYLDMGLVFGMDTLVSQAYGAKNFRLTGIIFQNALVVMTIGAIPISILWMFTKDILLLLGQSQELAEMAGKFAWCSLPGILPVIYYRASLRFFANQSVVKPALIISAIAFGLNIGMNYFFIYTLDLQFIGAPIATFASRLLMPILLWAYIIKSGIHKQTWPGFTKEAIAPKRLILFLRYGIPSMAMVFFEVAGYEINSIIVGTFKDATLLSVHAVCSSVLLTVWIVPNALSIGVSTRVGNLLGEGNFARAKTVANVGVLATFGLMTAMSIFVNLFRKLLPKIYTPEPAVVDIASDLFLLSSWTALLDGVQTVIGGVIRGAGLPKFASIVNFVGYYVIALPTGISLAMYASWNEVTKVAAIWLGLTAGLFFISFAFCIQLLRIDWYKESLHAQERSEKKEIILDDEDLQVESQVELDSISEPDPS
eukprot:TRINITY_DN4402_c0_g1_i2.p1 TRINITY_DN4402_c0_g1~~TRINITY_DN4402_c0_g1_i2.p1  ORF type:complete len:518 (-),score=139.01 TRINITY_DN4402_c0_g1_i2:65-1429(-)